MTVPRGFHILDKGILNVVERLQCVYRALRRVLGIGIFPVYAVDVTVMSASGKKLCDFATECWLEGRAVMSAIGMADGSPRDKTILIPQEL